MGVTDSRSILTRIETEHKSLRKYCDPVYGQITVLQHKSSKRPNALIQKTYLKSNTALHSFLQKGTIDHYLLKPENFYVCDMSLCSDIRLYFFMFEYSPHNLEDQISLRGQEGRMFSKEEAVRLFTQQVEIILLMRHKINPENGKVYRFCASNSNFLCSAMLELRTLQPVFKNDPQGFQEIDKVYLSPEAYRLARNGEAFRVRQALNRQSSVVFTLALNFMQLLLLADLSMIYQQHGEDFINFSKLSAALREVQEKYGSEISSLLSRMLHREQSKRPSLSQLKRTLQGKKTNRRSISRFQKQKQNSTEIY